MTLMIRVTGEADVVSKLLLFKNSVVKRVVTGAARAALRPIVAAAKAGVPVDQGYLKKSIGVIGASKSKKKRNEIKLMVGARKGYEHEVVNLFGKTVKVDPVRYAVPVEYGHVVVIKGKVVGKIAPVGFLRRAYETGRAKLVTDFAREMRDRVGRLVLRG